MVHRARGRLDQMTLDRAADAWATMNLISAQTGVPIDCVLNCSISDVRAWAEFNASPLTNPIPFAFAAASSDNTFILSTDPTYGTYFGTQPGFCSGGRVCTSGSGGVYGAISDYGDIAATLGVNPSPLTPVALSYFGLSYHASYAMTPVPTGVLGLRISPALSFYGYELRQVQARIDIPRGAFIGQSHRVTVHYYGLGTPPF